MKISSIKAVAVCLAIFISGTFLQAQDITGQWNSVLRVFGTNMRLVFHIDKKDESYTAKMDSLAAISATLKRGGNEKVTVKEYPGLNHLFQECTTGSPAEYASTEQTFSSEVLKDLGDWILAH